MGHFVTFSFPTSPIHRPTLQFRHAQDESRESLLFRYLPCLTVSSVVPSLGPVRGNTLIRIYGDGLDGGDGYLCRFGAGFGGGDGSSDSRSFTVAATYDDDSFGASAHEGAGHGGGGHVRCFTPPWGLEPPAPLLTPLFSQHLIPLRLSLDGGQHFSQADLSFAYHRELAVSAISPAAGPAAGGTLLRLQGGTIAGGVGGRTPRYDMLERSSATCQFGAKAGQFGAEAAVGGAGFATPSALVASVETLVVPASWAADGEALLCVSPTLAPRSRAESPLEVNVSTSLDGVSFGAPAQFTYMARPVLSALTPLSGKSLGGVTLTVTGSGFNSALSPECLFGAARVSATVVSSALLRCTSPSLGLAGANDASPAPFAPEELVPYGAAAYVAAADAGGGARLLSPGRTPEQVSPEGGVLEEGGGILRGGVILPLWHAAPPLTDWSLSFLLLASGRHPASDRPPLTHPSLGSWLEVEFAPPPPESTSVERVASSRGLTTPGGLRVRFADGGGGGGGGGRGREGGLSR